MGGGGGARAEGQTSGADGARRPHEDGRSDHRRALDRVRRAHALGRAFISQNLAAARRRATTPRSIASAIACSLQGSRAARHAAPDTPRVWSRIRRAGPGVGLPSAPWRSSGPASLTTSCITNGGWRSSIPSRPTRPASSHRWWTWALDATRTTPEKQSKCHRDRRLGRRALWRRAVRQAARSRDLDCAATLPGCGPARCSRPARRGRWDILREQRAMRRRPQASAKASPRAAAPPRDRPAWVLRRRCASPASSPRRGRSIVAGSGTRAPDGGSCCGARAEPGANDNASGVATGAEWRWPWQRRSRPAALLAKRADDHLPFIPDQRQPTVAAEPCGRRPQVNLFS